MKKLILCLTIIAVSGCANQVINQTTSELTKHQKIEQVQRCAKLKQQIKDLKGKPLRRTSAREYYEKECLQ